MAGLGTGWNRAMFGDFEVRGVSQRADPSATSR
jgi:hypothetical protein